MPAKSFMILTPETAKENKCKISKPVGANLLSYKATKFG